MNRKLYQALAYRIEAAANCAKRNMTDRRDGHLEVVRALVREHMPSGSGFDGGTQIDIDASTADKLVFVTSVHHLHEQGYYDGWTDHVVTVRPTFQGIQIAVGGRNRNFIKDYMHEVFHIALTSDVDGMGNVTSKG